MPRQVATEVKSGDRKRALAALRDRLAEAIDDETDSGDLAALTLRLTRVLAELHDMGGASGDEEKDDLAARRAAKLSAATGP